MITNTDNNGPKLTRSLSQEEDDGEPVSSARWASSMLKTTLASVIKAIYRSILQSIQMIFPMYFCLVVERRCAWRYLWLKARFRFTQNHRRSYRLGPDPEFLNSTYTHTLMLIGLYASCYYIVVIVTHTFWINLATNAYLNDCEATSSLGSWLYKRRDPRWIF